jgi:hypothetical protein
MKYLSVKRNDQSKPSYLDSKKISQNQIQIISCCFFCYCYNENARANGQGLLKFTTKAANLSESKIKKVAFKLTTTATKLSETSSKKNSKSAFKFTKLKKSRPYGKFAQPPIQNETKILQLKIMRLLLENTQLQSRY